MQMLTRCVADNQMSWHLVSVINRTFRTSTLIQDYLWFLSSVDVKNIKMYKKLTWTFTQTTSSFWENISSERPPINWKMPKTYYSSYYLYWQH